MLAGVLANVRGAPPFAGIARMSDGPPADRAAREEDLAAIARVDRLHVEPGGILGERPRRAARVDPPEARTARVRVAALRDERRAVRREARSQEEVASPRPPRAAVALRLGTSASARPEGGAPPRNAKTSSGRRGDHAGHCSSRSRRACDRGRGLAAPDPRAAGRAARHRSKPGTRGGPPARTRSGHVSSTAGVAVSARAAESARRTRTISFDASTMRTSTSPSEAVSPKRGAGSPHAPSASAARIPATDW